MSTGFATLASAGSSSREPSRVSSASSRQREPGRLARVGAEDAEPAGVRDHRDPPAARQRLAAEHAATSISSSSVPARITPAWRKSASTAASEPASAAVCELAAARARRRSCRS